MTTSQPKQNRGIVKQVLSGDCVSIRGEPKGGPPPEKIVYLSNIQAPRLGRRATPNGEATKDEPYAWDAREFLRKKIIGVEVIFTVEKPPNSNREYGCIYLGKDIATGENLTESLISEGLVKVRESAPKRLIELQSAAIAAGKGLWDTTTDQEHIRDIKWSVENPRNFLDKNDMKPFKAVVEHVRDGSTVRAFLLPDFYHITLMISGIRAPTFKLDANGKPDQTAKYAEEAKFFVERMLLQRDVEIILESLDNNNFYIGSIIHPQGNIAEALLKQGFAICVNWSMAVMKSGADKLRAAEKHARENKIRYWNIFQPTGPQISGKEKEFSGLVCEVVNGDVLMIKLSDGSVKKVFLASIRPPRDQRFLLPTEEKPNEALPPRPKGFRPLYDIPWMFEAREFLRKKLIGKRVNVVVDYIQAAKDNFLEKVCCTVTISGVNVAEAMVSKGFATVVRYRQDNDQRSSHYDELLAAEVKAHKSGNGIHAKKNIPNHRVADIAGDLTKAKQFLPFLQRAQRTEALVEFVASGSRLRLFISKETCLITFLLGGINCPRGSRPGPGNNGTVEGEPYADEALTFTKEKCLQREVQIHVESMDKAGNFIGWLWVEGINLSVALVQEGLAAVHFTAERSEYFRQLKNAEDSAKAAKERIWKNYVEENEEEKKVEEDRVTERKIDYQEVFIIEATNELHFYAQFVDQGPKLEQLMTKIRQEFTTNPPLPGSYRPMKGDICAAKFAVDDQWYRARVEKVSGSDISVFYIDYGNREVLNVSQCASLSSNFTSEKAYAHEYALACAQLPPLDNDYREEAVKTFKQDVESRLLSLNVEYKNNNISYATLVDKNQNDEDIAKTLIADGLLRVELRKEKRFKPLVTDYFAAQENAKNNRSNIWEYGDITEDDAKEFGY